MDLGHKEGGVIIDLTSQISGEERRLNVGQQTDRHLLPEVGVSAFGD